MRNINSLCLVDDDMDVLDAVGETLRRGGYRVRKCHGAQEAADLLTDDWPGIVLTDMRMPRMTGIGLLEHLRVSCPSVPVILFSGHGDVSAAIKIMKLGAEDFIEKPIEPDLLLEIVARAMEKRRLFLQNQSLMERLEGSFGFTQALPGQSDAMKRLRAQIRQVASSSLNTLIAGESGSGKSSAARALHALSASQPDAYIEANGRNGGGARLAEALGAHARNGGEGSSLATVYIRHVDALSLEMQELLLFHSERLPLRVIGSVEGTLETLQKHSDLSPDFLYFLNGAYLEVPAIRVRREDILPLLRQKLKAIRRRSGGQEVVLEGEMLEQLKAYDWPGNLREINNIAERLSLGLDLHLRSAQRAEEGQQLDYKLAMEQFERRLIESVLAETGGRKSRAAEILGMPRKRLYLRMKSLEMLG